MNILFIGDIVGSIGRRMIKEKLEYFVEKYQVDFVIANGENATHGKGLIRHHYEELIDNGVDCITLGNHYDSKREITRYIDNADRLIRPINLAKDFPGEGTIEYDVDGIKVRVTNVLCSAFMGEEVKSPYYSLLDVIDQNDAPIHIVDLHGEATGEKYSIAYALDGKVSAVLGTHTHIQTNDAKILPNGTGYISDVGMTGFTDGILGFDKDTIIKKNIFNQMSKFEPPSEGRGLLSAVLLKIDEISGKCQQISTIYFEEK